MNKNINSDNSSFDKSLLEVINSSYLSVDDVNWLKNKWWFKRFLKIYAKELKKRYENISINNNDKPIIKEIENKNNKKNNNDILEYTQSIKMPSEEVVEILDFTKTLDITSIKDVTVATSNAKKKVKLEKKIWTFILCICLFALTILSVILINWFLENKKTNNVVDDIYEVAEIEKVTTTTKKEEDKNTTKKLSDYEKYADMNMFNVNFDNLKNINNDTKGWVKVPGSNINYPFVQTTNNEYYLKHSFDKSSTKKGWVFLDYRNDIDNLTKNTILYAHGAVNNTMFGSMRKILKPSWYNKKSNHFINVLTPNNNYVWQVFSIYTIEPESYYITSNFSSDAEFKDFLDIIKSRSIYDFNVNLDVKDNILTLSSCYDNTKRMVLHAKLIQK